MLSKSQIVDAADISIDRNAHSITLRRIFAAPRVQVFDAWTQPAHVKSWWDPAGVPLAECEIDLRPGGAFKFVNAGAGAAYCFSGVYREIVRPEYLIFQGMGAIARVDFEQQGSGTLLTVQMRCESAAGLERYLKMGIHIGTGRTLDNFVAHVRAQTG